MSIYHYELIKDGDVRAVNRLLLQGWQPVRETIMPDPAHATKVETPSVLILFEKEASFPVLSGEFIGGQVPLSTVAEVPLMAGMEPEELRELSAQMDIRGYAADELIFEKNADERVLQVIVSGRVRVELPDLPLEEASVIELEAGDVFGESTFFAAASHSTKGIAVSPVTTVRLARERYDELLQGGRMCAFKLALNAAELLGFRLQETDDWLWSMIREDQSAQIAASWKRFRHRVSGYSSPTGGFFKA